MLGLSAENSCLGLSELLSLQKCGFEPHKSLVSALEATVSEACLHATIEALKCFVFSLLQTQLRSLAACCNNLQPGLHVEVRESYTKKWGEEASSAFENVLLKLLVNAGLSDATHENILNTLMELILSELPKKFNNVLYWKLCVTLVESEVSVTNIIKALSSQYLQYEDVRYFTAKNVHKLAMQHLYANFTAKESQEGTYSLIRKSGATHNLFELACGLIPVLQCGGVDLVEEASYLKFCRLNSQLNACVVNIVEERTKTKALAYLEQNVKCEKKDAYDRSIMSPRSEQVSGIEEEEGRLSETDCSKARIEVLPFESMEKIEPGVIDSNWLLSAARGKDEENHASTKDGGFVSGGKDKRKGEEEDDAEDDESDDYEGGGASDDNDGNDDAEGEEEGNEDDDNEGDEDDEEDDDEYDEEVAAQFAQQSKAVANEEDDEEDEENGHGEGEEGIEGEESEGEDEEEGVDEDEFEEEDGGAEEDEDDDEDEDEDEEEEAAQPPKKKSKGA